MVMVGLFCLICSTAELAVRENSEVLSFESPTTATLSLPETPPNVPVPETSALAKARAIKPMKASTRASPIFELNILRKNPIIRRLNFQKRAGFPAELQFAVALYPACDLLATGAKRF